MSGTSSPLHTRIWQEEAQADNPFATHTAHCHGYDVYGQMLGRATWVDMLYLLFKGQAPSPAQARLLEALALALANPGPRDPMVHAAMSGGVGGSHAAASLIAAPIFLYDEDDTLDKVAKDQLIPVTKVFADLVDVLDRTPADQIGQ